MVLHLLVFSPCILSTLCKLLWGPQSYSGVVNEGVNETGLNFDPESPLRTPWPPCSLWFHSLPPFANFAITFLTVFNPDNSAHSYLSWFTINLKGRMSSSSIIKFPEKPTYNTQYIYFMYYNSIRKPVKDSNIFILLTLSSISIYIYSCGADGFVRK